MGLCAAMVTRGVCVPSRPLGTRPLVLQGSEFTLLQQPLVWGAGPGWGAGPDPPSGYRGVLGGVNRQEGSGLAGLVWGAGPFFLSMLCDWPGGLSLPLSAPPGRGLL